MDSNLKMEELKIDTFSRFTLTTLTDWLNRNCKKKGYKEGEENFSVSDVQGYIKRGVFPSYIKKGYQIQIVKFMDIPGAKIYKLKEVKLHKK